MDAHGVKCPAEMTVAPVLRSEKKDAYNLYRLSENPLSIEYRRQKDKGRLFLMGFLNLGLMIVGVPIQDRSMRSCRLQDSRAFATRH